jgi:hypothetical protein
MTAEKVKEESQTIEWPAPSIIGAATPEKFFNALKPSDLESGFANRLLILPFEGHQRPAERQTTAKSQEPPKSLIAELKKLDRRMPFAQRILKERPGAERSVPPLPKRERMEWGEGAADVYLAFSRKMDEFEGIDRQRYELGMRAAENAVRLATIVAAGRGSQTVDCDDIKWAVAVA